MKDSINESLSFLRRNSKRYSVRFNQLKKSSSAILSSKKSPLSSIPLVRFTLFDDKKSPVKKPPYYPIATSKSTSYLYPKVNRNDCYDSESDASSCLPTPSSSIVDLPISGTESYQEEFGYSSAPSSLAYVNNSITVPPLIEDEPPMLNTPRVICVHKKPNPLSLSPPVRPARKRHLSHKKHLEPPDTTGTSCIDMGSRNILEGLHISQLLSDGESDVDVSDDMSSDESFEKNLEANLESIENDDDDDIEVNPVRKFRGVQLRNKSKLQLYIDTDLARAHGQRDRGLRRIVEEDVESLSSKSSHSTPRSPTIDIDEIFRQRKKNLQEEPRSSMPRVKNLIQQLHLEKPGSTSLQTWLKSNKDESPKFSENSPTNILDSLNWVKTELSAMRKQDDSLASQFIQLRLEMQKLRLVTSCHQHEKLLDEVAFKRDHQKDLESSDFCDFPKDFSDTTSTSKLKQMGLTQMNITNRRFSLR